MLYKLILCVYKESFIVINMIQKNLQIREDQEDFLKDQTKSFNFSKFVRNGLDEYIKFKKELKGG